MRRSRRRGAIAEQRSDLPGRVEVDLTALGGRFRAAATLAGVLEAPDLGLHDPGRCPRRGGGPFTETRGRPIACVESRERIDSGDLTKQKKSFVAPCCWRTKSSWRHPHCRCRAPACSTASERSLSRASTAGWCRRPRWRSISASAWPTGSRCSGCRCPSALGGANGAATACGDRASAELFTTSCDWHVAALRWMYTLFFVLARVCVGASGAAGSSASARARPASCGACAGAAAC